MIVTTIFGTEEVLSKDCIYCKEIKPLVEFPKHSYYYDGYDTRCMQCIRERNKKVSQIRKTAPPKSIVCDCCGKKPNVGVNVNSALRVRGLALDHDPTTNVFRGWLCNGCNTAIGALGDSLEGVLRAVDYLKRYEERKNG
jgi:hypothetical protein